ncbi:DUF2231 domain-containing protein [Piscinibacter terrae]|uniref:DUF2231 domain-containing protein n=1 Tax=Piscinibacter terrae TaxID=2496871 RepID=A0A3N7HJV7_9BURK|nr:DUF2231 domain-containing protein [Albitalea terrae]RQP21813.1 DUF2231 domain-containing protein [Albitalea terrae]
MAKPIHPILVHFPIALLVTSFVADATYFFTSMGTLRDAGWWMLAAAAASSIPTVLAGLFDMRRTSLKEDVHERVHRHMWVGITLLGVIVALAVWRWTFYASTGRALPMLYLDASFLAVALAAFQGWLGGELVYTHAVFVGPQEQAPESGAAHTGHEHGDAHTHSH